MRIWIDVCESVSANHKSKHATHVEHAECVRQAAVAPGQRTLDLVPLQVPLDERPVALPGQEPVHLLVRLDEPGERRLELDPDLVPGLCDLLPDRQQHGRAPLSQPQAREPVDVDELEGVPDIEQRPCSLLEADDGRELEDVDADLEEFVDDLARCAEYVDRRFRDALRRRLAWNQVRRWGKAEEIAEKSTVAANASRGHRKHSRKWLTVLLCTGRAAFVAENA